MLVCDSTAKDELAIGKSGKMASAGGRSVVGLCHCGMGGWESITKAERVREAGSASRGYIAVFCRGRMCSTCDSTASGEQAIGTSVWVRKTGSPGKG